MILHLSDQECKHHLSFKLLDKTFVPKNTIRIKLSKITNITMICISGLGISYKSLLVQTKDLITQTKLDGLSQALHRHQHPILQTILYFINKDLKGQMGSTFAISHLLR